MDSHSDWLVWQLADSAFPSGGFAHSAGLEAAHQLGEVDGAEGLAAFMRASLLQAARGAAPFAVAAAKGGNIPDLDRAHDSFLTSAVANRASRAQGQGFLAAACRAIRLPALTNVREQIVKDRLPGHWPVVFGATCGMLGVPGDRVARLLLFISLRSLISAAVRLGIVGPIQGQSIQFDLHDLGERLATRAAETDPDDAAQTAPVIELLQGAHDRLYSKLFLS